MSLEFKKIEVNSIQEMLPFYARRHNMTCDSVFLESYVWKDYYNVRYAIWENKALLWLMENEGRCFSAMPLCREEDLPGAFVSDFRKMRPKKLSGGLLRRLNIACGIVHKPRLIIMDEPTVAVDPQSRNKILEGILELNRQGSTIIYTSHYMEEVEQICTRIAIIDHGRVLASGTTEELKKMIKTGETITIEAVALTKNNLADIRSLSHVFDLSYQDQTMILRCSGAKHNLIRVLNYLQEQDIPFGRVFSELPTLNDVFLEITGKELRD